jgi:CHAT domain-containing protein
VVYNDASQSQTVVKALRRDEFKEDDLHKLLEGWFQSYARFHVDPHSHFPEFCTVIDETTQKLWVELMGPLITDLQNKGFKEVILIPTGLLAYLPLHAAWTEENGRRLYALDRLAIRYAPSARALNHARRMEKTVAAKHFLAVDNPLPITQARPLRYSYQEVSAIEVHFSQENEKVLHNEEATKEAVLQELPQAQVAHFSCHGAANLSEPEESGLLLARDERLTVLDLFQLRLPGARMAVLSACESGVVGSKLPDEVVSLPSAFLQAGFAGVLASLWSVDEKSTSQLMDCFYRLWLKERLDPAFALQKAQQCLRDNHWKDSFYWAAFYLSGV